MRERKGCLRVCWSRFNQIITHQYRLLGVLAINALLFSAVSGIAHAEDRLALVIGNSRYEYASPLRNPENDIKLVSESLTQTGFKVTLLDNVRREGMDAALKQFIEQAKKLDHPTVVIYYAGHGTQIDGDNYLLPIDAKVDTSKSLSDSSISLGKIVDNLSTVSANLQLLVIDACRDDPFRAKGRGISRGLARVGETKGRLIAFSTSPGSLAQDGSSGTSPYASALAETMLVPGLSLEDTFKRTRQLVQERTHGQQEPWENGSLYGNFYFSPASGPSSLPTAEQDFWDLTSVIDTEEAYKKYLNRFHDGRFAKLANQKIAALNRDFSFRRQNETFPVLVASESAIKANFECGQKDENNSDFDIRGFGSVKESIIYVDISINAANMLCLGKDNISKLANFYTTNDKCASMNIFRDVSQDGITGSSAGIVDGDMPKGCDVDKDLLRDGDGQKYIKGNPYFFRKMGSSTFIAPIVKTSYYQLDSADTEGQPESGQYRIQGLVRVHAEYAEEDSYVILEPVDPAELGMSAKYQSTRDAVRTKNFIKDMDLNWQATLRSREIDKEFGVDRNDIAEAKKIEKISSYWLHNGSIVGLKKDGLRRTLIYLRPRDGLDAIGIRAGTVLFDGGTPDGSLYQGQSQTFLKRCGSVKFPIAGQVANDNKAISLIGSAPKFDTKCRQTGVGQAALNFSFIATSATIDIGSLIKERFPTTSEPGQNTAQSLQGTVGGEEAD